MAESTILPLERARAAACRRAPAYGDEPTSASQIAIKDHRLAQVAPFSQWRSS